MKTSHHRAPAGGLVVAWVELLRWLRGPTIAGASYIGAREENEDCWAGRRWGALSVLVVADGLGGHDDGALAAQVAVQACLTHMRRSARAPLPRLVEEALQGAAEAVRAERRRRNSDMGCAIALLAVRRAQAAWAHAGDVRIYQILPDAMRRLTVDHSLATARLPEDQRLVADTRGEPSRNLLLSHLGADEPIIEVGQGQVGEGASYLLCTDGLWEGVDDSDLAAVLGEPAAAAVERLCAKVAARGLPDQDNYTVALLRP